MATQIQWGLLRSKRKPDASSFLRCSPRTSTAILRYYTPYMKKAQQDLNGGMNMTELEPCPFCGNEVSILVVGVNSDNYVIRCPTRDCFTNTGWGHSDKAQLTEMWNRRADSLLTIDGQVIDCSKIKRHVTEWNVEGY